MKHRTKTRQVQNDCSVIKPSTRTNMNTSVENNRIQTLSGMSPTMSHIQWKLSSHEKKLENVIQSRGVGEGKQPIKNGSGFTKQDFKVPIINIFNEWKGKWTGKGRERDGKLEWNQSAKLKCEGRRCAAWLWCRLSGQPLVQRLDMGCVVGWTWCPLWICEIRWKWQLGMSLGTQPTCRTGSPDSTPSSLSNFC